MEIVDLGGIEANDGDPAAFLNGWGMRGTDDQAIGLAERRQHGAVLFGKWRSDEFAVAINL